MSGAVRAGSKRGCVSWRAGVLASALAACTADNPGYRRAGAGVPPDDTGRDPTDASVFVEAAGDAGRTEDDDASQDDGSQAVDGGVVGVEAPVVDASQAAEAMAVSPDAAALPPDAAGAPRDVGSPAADVSSPAPDAAAAPTSIFNFESDTQGWSDLRFTYYGGPESPAVRSTAKSFDGVASLEVTLKTTTSYTLPTIGLGVANGTRPACGALVSYRIWLPTGNAIQGVQPFVMYGKRGFTAVQWGGVDPIIWASDLAKGSWNLITFRVPSDCTSVGVVELGLEWRTNGAQTVKVYMDAITW